MAEDKEYLSNYETVKERKKKFYEKFPNGTIQTNVLQIFKEGEAFLLQAIGFREPNDPRPYVGHAYQWKDSEHNINSVAWFENGEESAIGRMLDNAGFAGNNKCSRDEIIKANAKREVKTTPITEKFIRQTKKEDAKKEEEPEKKTNAPSEGSPTKTEAKVEEKDVLAPPENTKPTTKKNGLEQFPGF